VYDLGDRLTSVTPPTQSATTFTFDALGRIASRVRPGGTDAYEYLGTTNTAWRITTGATVVSSALDPSGARLATKTGTTIGFTLPDLHANLAAVVNSGETGYLSAVRYDPYGQTPTSSLWDSGGSFPTPWKFQGRLDLSPDTTDPLYDFGARFYSPGIGAFTQLDDVAGSTADPHVDREFTAGRRRCCTS
jgi:RHS repeat-associated protein